MEYVELRVLGYMLWLVFFPCDFYLLFFLTESQRSEIGCIAYLHTWCGLSANLECISEMCCTRLAENTARKISPKICHLLTIAQLCRALSSQLRHISTSGKLVKQQYLLHMSSQYCELWLINGRNRLAGLGHPSIFQRVSRLCFFTAQVNQTLHDAWPTPGLVHYVYVFGAVAS